MEHTELKPCPFCGGEAEKTLIGNAFTKSRKVIIKCTKCFATQTNGAIYHDHVWLDEIATQKWNNRFDLKPVEIPEMPNNTFSGQSTPDLCCGVYEEPPLELRICTRCGKEFKSNVDCPICPSCYL
jgi:hypothetical protein